MVEQRSDVDRLSPCHFPRHVALLGLCQLPPGGSLAGRLRHLRALLFTTRPDLFKEVLVAVLVEDQESTRS